MSMGTSPRTAYPRGQGELQLTRIFDTPASGCGSAAAITVPATDADQGDAAPGLTVTGKVIDDAGNPVAGAAFRY